MLDGRNQHQHGGHERHERPHRHPAGVALPQGRGNHARQRRRRQHLGQRCHGRRGDGGLEGQPAQSVAEHIEPLGLGGLCAVQADQPVGQYVFLHHVGQGIGGFLAGLGQAVEALGQHPHHQNQGRKNHDDDERQLPVQVKQIAQQRQQGQAVFGQRQEGSHQHACAGLHFVHQRVGQTTGGLLFEQLHVGHRQPLEHVAAHVQHAGSGGVAQGVLGQKTGQSAHAKQPQQGSWHHPQRHRTRSETFVQQGFEQGGDEWLGQCAHQRGDCRQDHAAAGGCEIRPQAAQPVQQGGVGRQFRVIFGEHGLRRKGGLALKHWLSINPKAGLRYYRLRCHLPQEAGLIVQLPQKFIRTCHCRCPGAPCWGPPL